VAAPAILKIDIIADATKAAAALDKTGKAASGTGSKLKAIAGAATTGLAVGAMIQFGKASAQAALEAGKNTARLEQVFRSMGDTTGSAAKAAEDYASKLSKHIGVDDDAIMKGQALLATFGAVSGETARAAGIFDRATAAGADLAAAGFGTIESNAVQLGKALQDPVKGLAALGRSGVTFTAAQKKQITNLVKHNKLLDAQKIVLGAVEQQVGGTAAATATSADKMNVAFGETEESIGNALLPVLNALAPMLQTIAEFIQKNIGWLMPLAVVIGVLAVAWNIASVAATLFGTSMLAALWPVLLVIAAIAALIAIGVLIVKNWDTIKAAASAVWQFMQRAWDGILNAVRTAFNWIKANWPLLLAILTGPIGIAVALIVTHWSTIRSAIAAVLSWIRGAFGTLLGVLTAPFEAAWHVIDAVFGRISGAVQSALSFVSSTASSIANALRAPLNAIIRGWNAIEIRIPAFGAGPFKFGGATIGLPDIPELATGGTVMRTGFALVHAGEMFSGVGGALAGGGTVINVNVTTTGLGADAPQIQRAVVRALRGFTARNGPLDVPVRSAG
jgi:phage-related protein